MFLVLERFTLLVDDPSNDAADEEEYKMEHYPFITGYITVVLLLSARVQCQDLIKRRLFSAHFIRARTQYPQQTYYNESSLDSGKQSIGVILGRVSDIIAKHILIQHHKPEHQQRVALNESKQHHYQIHPQVDRIQYWNPQT